MSKTWAQIDSELDVLLDDAGRTSFSDALRMDAFNRAALYFAATHTAPMKQATGTTSSYMDGVSVVKPDDLLELAVGGVQDLDSKKGGWLEPVRVTPGYTVPTDGYIELPDVIYLLDATVTNVRIWYYSTYVTVTSDADISGIPIWAEWGVVCLAAAYMLFPNMMNQQNLRQFQGKQDAGSPEDNPPRTQARFLMGIYQSVVNARSAQNRNMMFKAGPR